MIRLTHGQKVKMEGDVLLQMEQDHVPENAYNTITYLNVLGYICNPPIPSSQPPDPANQPQTADPDQVGDVANSAGPQSLQPSNEDLST